MRRFPDWIKRRLAGGEDTAVRAVLNELGLATVCQSACCPNIHECFAKNTTTFMILGKVCTRGCRFCAVESGNPAPIDVGEPERVGEAARRLGLSHVVVTSVTRDDLPDLGSGYFARTIEAIRRMAGATVEVLVPDFLGRADCITRVLDASPDVFAHNMETVARLYQSVRPGADYARSLGVLKAAKAASPGCRTKSGMMVGLGETGDEVMALLCDLREAKCDAVTIGQYLRPSARHIEVAEFVPPEKFEFYGREARKMGFRSASAGPFVRSSYNAAEAFQRELAYGQQADCF